MLFAHVGKHTLEHIVREVPQRHAVWTIFTMLPACAPGSTRLASPTLDHLMLANARRLQKDSQQSFDARLVHRHTCTRRERSCGLSKLGAGLAGCAWKCVAHGMRTTSLHEKAAIAAYRLHSACSERRRRCDRRSNGRQGPWWHRVRRYQVLVSPTGGGVGDRLHTDGGASVRGFTPTGCARLQTVVASGF